MRKVYDVRHFVIPGEPVGKGRPRFSRNGHAYTPEATAAYENLVKLEYERQVDCEPYEKGIPLVMTINAMYSIPASAGKKQRQLMLAGAIFPTKKPDCDNIIKIIADALNGLAYYDDSQLSTVSIVKRYAPMPRVEVWISGED